jgi:diacylglycerol kinase (ATP)
MVLKKVGRLELLKVFPRVYKGTHVSHPAVSIYRCREISVVGSGSAYADGEKVSQLPYTAETIPGALLAWSA